MSPRIVGTYLLGDEIGAGGMATVHLGCAIGAGLPHRAVAIKQLHPQLAREPSFVQMFRDEARVASRMDHPNIVRTLEVVATSSELFLVMEYCHGETLASLQRRAEARGDRIAPAIAAAIVIDLLHALEAAHNAKDERGLPLNLVHRDVSPQNVLVGADGRARLLDFGVAKAAGLQTTREGGLKGKIAYMAPEQVRGRPPTPSMDIYGASIVLWEALTGRRLFQGDTEAAIFEQVMVGLVDPPSKFAPNLSDAVDAITLRGLAQKPSLRFESAREMAVAIARAIPPATHEDVAACVRRWAGETLAQREASVDALFTTVSRGTVDLTRRDRSPQASWEPAGLVVAEPRPSLLAPSRPRTFAAAAAVVAIVALVPILHRARAHETTAAAPIAIAEAAPSPSPASMPPEPAPPLFVELETAPDAAAKPIELDADAVAQVHARPPPRRAPRVAAPRPACDPPFTRDSLGRKIYKIECLKRH